MAKAYLKNKDLLSEFLFSKYQNDGEPTETLIKYLQLMVSRMAEKFSFQNYDDRKDSQQDAFIALWKNWLNFNDELYTQIFPYYSEIIKRSFTMSHNVRMKHSGVPLGSEEINWMF
jgi:DNA-directed RNA polymerase specialized sigma subunit